MIIRRSLLIALIPSFMIAGNQPFKDDPIQYNYPLTMNGAFTHDISYDCPQAGIIPTRYSSKLSTSLAKYANCKAIWDHSVVNDVINFNNAISTTSTIGINQLYVYGSDLKFNDKAGAMVTLSSLNSSTPQIEDTDKKPYYGDQNLSDYQTAINASTGHKIVYYSVMIEGHSNALGTYAQFLGLSKTNNPLNTNSKYNFNESLSKDDATKLATQMLIQGYTDPNNTSTTYPGICNAKNIKGGVEFNLGNFKLKDDGTCHTNPDQPECSQYNFYKAIKTIFDTKPTANDANPCYGKYFSVEMHPDNLITSKGVINPDAQDLFANSPDSYVILSLYDLGGLTTDPNIQKNTTCPADQQAQGTCKIANSMTSATVNQARAGFIGNSETYYKTNVSNELTKNLPIIDQAGIHYQLALPAAATQHEFDSYRIQSKIPIPRFPFYGNAFAANTFAPYMVEDDINNDLYTNAKTTDNVNGQANILSDAISAVHTYLNTSPKNYLGIVLSSFQPPAGNHFAPRNIDSDAAHSKSSNGKPNEYYMVDENGKSTSNDDASEGLVNPNVYMRLYSPNTICATGTGTTGCLSDKTAYTDDEKNVFSKLTTEAKTTDNMSILSFLPSIVWPSFQDDFKAIPHTYDADGKLTGTFDTNAKVIYTNTGLPTVYTCGYTDPKHLGYIGTCQITLGTNNTATIEADLNKDKIGDSGVLEIIVSSSDKSKTKQFIYYSWPVAPK